MSPICKRAALCAIVVGTPACYASHTIPLPGERYQCECTFTEELPDADVTCAPDDTGSWECEPSVCVGPGCIETRTHAATIHPCTVFAGDPTGVCDAACADSRFFPTSVTVSGVRRGAGSYSGPGLCGTDGPPPREFFFPDVPVDAVRNGWVVASMSTLELTVEGLGSTGVFEPVDATPVAIQGGACEGLSCPLAINSFRIEVPEGVTLDGNSVDSLTIRLAGGAPWGAAEADGAGQWRLLGTTADNSALPLEFFGSIAGNTEEGDFLWERPPASVADGPGGDIDLRRTAPDPHMRFTGTIRDTIELESGEVLAAEVVADIYVRFISGAPVPRAMMSDVGMATGPLTLDGSNSYDTLGAAIAEYQWLVKAGSDERRIATGIRAAVARPIVATYREQGYEVCLRAYDGDGFFDDVCEGDMNFIEEPGLPEPTCPEVILTPASSDRFRALVSAAGLDQELEQYAGVTWLVPTDAAFDEIKPEKLEAMLGDPESALEFVLSQAVEGVYSWEELSTQPSERWTLAGTKLTLDPSILEDLIRLPDQDCPDGTTHHVGTIANPTGALSG